MAKHLEDIGKDAKDLLGEGYPIDGTVKVTAQTSGFGFVQKATLNRSLKKDKTGVKEIVSAAFEPKYEFKEHKVEVTGKYSSTNEVSVGASVRDLVGAGSKLEGTVVKSDRDGLNGVFTASYKINSFAGKAKLTYPFTPAKPIKINSEVVFHHSGTSSNFGVGVDANVEGDAIRIFSEAVVAHTAKDSQYKGQVRYDVFESALVWGVSFWQRVSEKNNWAFDLTSESYGGNKTTFTAGTDYKVDEWTLVKGKWRLIKSNDRVDYRLGASLKQKLSPHVIATLGSDLNFRSFLGASAEGEPHTFGLEIKYQD
jgi:hypothetical protein